MIFFQGKRKWREKNQTKKEKKTGYPSVLLVGIKTGLRRRDDDDEVGEARLLTIITWNTFITQKKNNGRFYSRMTK